MQQVLRGHGTGVSWGRTPLRGRVSRTAGATAVYALVTLANAVYGGEVPALMQPNGSPAIEAYDAAMGAMIRGAPPRRPSMIPMAKPCRCRTLSRRRTVG